ncbi:MAG TPA: enoyl-CoA hydratase-related protein [Pseudomonadales bacterium]|jgi:enoyl-CoA hydratase|nr:enoyl-CoA hydratase [Gammaproteobacteria bacterium]MDP6025233.1 enoyl-CoA hydratase-related protein [Pseudomonadales bacterium]MDP6315324.1 enoyl-CoA hydratase-related protein [Pseudomonadales bacterium]MDP7314772.1 enoyl-CoA hydratase-related protein [Pseudomonadales bacterium]HJL61009.1 enoyl-CoA hydratase-related protein [Pseudomonadales bacterium]|tara:strand:+ start:7694 stop:8488 length:795 start_codon:yes stop_codon:yes gene_type:complete
MKYENYQTLNFDYEGRVLTVTIDAPGPVNAVNDPLHSELARVFSDIQSDPDSDIIVLTGSGGTFCAGGDMDWFQDMIDDPTKFRAIGPDAKRIVFSLLDLEKPIICRLNGAAVGLGASVALLCDIIVAVEDAVIGDPHVKVGLVAGDGGAVIWPQLIGYARAKEYLLTGELLTASRAVEIGLVNYAVSSDELDVKVGEIVARIAANPRWAVRWTKTATNLPLKDIANRVMDAAIAYETITNLTEDRQEAVRAFVEKRKPVYKGE